MLSVGLAASVAGAAYLAQLHRFAADLSTANVALGDEMARRKEVERTREQLSGVLETTSDLVAMAEPGDHLRYLNRAGRALVGIGEREDIERILLTDLLRPSSGTGPPNAIAPEGDLWQGWRASSRTVWVRVIERQRCVSCLG